MDNAQSESNSCNHSMDRFTRWQKITIDQLGYALNLILTFTVAALGSCFALLKDSGFNPGCTARCSMLLSLLTLAGSAIAGLACVLNRLEDFRGTARHLRGKPDAPDRELLDRMGQKTWILFYVHFAFFALGLVALATTLLLVYGGKLV